MVIKVCGIKSKENVEFVSALDIDMVGLNFYPPSVRYISPDISPNHFALLPKKIKKVGVFVNESQEKIDAIASKFDLDYIQLHGDESVEFCKSISQKYKTIKVFRVTKETDISVTYDFSFVDYFLFDTATKHFGGSGKKFDWSQLEKYNGDTPFLLSGGIGPTDAMAILEYDHPQFFGIDINSKFESAPGIKHAQLVIPFVQKIIDSRT